MTTVPTTDDFQAMSQKMDRLEAMFTVITRSLCLPDVVKINDICEVEGVSYTQITQKEAYLLPRFGKSAFPDGTCRWPLKEYLDWHAIPPEEKKAAWQKHLNETLKKDMNNRNKLPNKE